MDLSIELWKRILTSTGHAHSELIVCSRRTHNGRKLFLFDHTPTSSACTPRNSIGSEASKKSDVASTGLVDVAIVKDVVALSQSCQNAYQKLGTLVYESSSFCFYSLRDAQLFQSNLTPTTAAHIRKIKLLDVDRVLRSYPASLLQSVAIYQNLQVLTLSSCVWLGNLKQGCCWNVEFLERMIELKRTLSLVKVLCESHEQNSGSFRFVTSGHVAGEEVRSWTIYYKGSPTSSRISKLTLKES